MLYAALKPLVAAVGRLWFRLESVGTERVPLRGAVLLASNHQSLLDPPLIGAVLPRELDYLAKAELFRVPLLGALIGRLNAHPVEREGADAAALRLALRLLQEGRALLVFPEGTRGDGGGLNPARPGTGMLAALSEAPVVPVYVAGSADALPRGRGFPRRARVTVRFGPALRFARERGKGRYQAISDVIMAAIGRLRSAAEPGRPAVDDARTDPTTPGPAPAGRIH